MPDQLVWSRGTKVACPGRCAAWSMKGVYSVSPRRRASTPLCLRVLWRNDALQTSISGLPEIGTQICASRVNPTCVDRYTHRLRDGPGPAVHRFAIARAAPHPGHVTPYLSAYGIKLAGDAREWAICSQLTHPTRSAISPARPCRPTRGRRLRKSFRRSRRRGRLIRPPPRRPARGLQARRP